MATVIVRYCDQHMAAEEEVRADNWALSINPPGARALKFDVDLCPDCSKPLLELIEAMQDIARKGQAPAKVPAKFPNPGGGRQADPNDPDSVQCPSCGHWSPGRSALGSHARSRHDMSISEILGEKLKFRCTRCPEEPPMLFGSGTGFGAHRRAVHQLPAGSPYLPGEDLSQGDQLELPEGKVRVRKNAAKKAS